MKFTDQKPNRINLPAIIIFFVLGTIIVSNFYLICEDFNLQSQIQKLKHDDATIAVVINKILSQIQPLNTQNQPQK